jgi:hypothetical protein
LFVAPGTTGNVLTSDGSTWSSTAPAAGTTFSAGTTGFTPSTATSGAVTLAGTLAVANGGTGQTTYTNGQLLIGNTTGNTLTKATLTQGTGVTITNGNGAITIAATGTGGTVTSVGGTGTVNGLSLSGTVTTSGNLTLGGTLSSVANSALTNSSVTVTAGTGMSGGGAVALGSSVTLTNAGVTSNVAGTGISVSGATGAVTITNSGVTSIVAGTGISVSGATGAVTVTNSGGAPGMVLVSTINAAAAATIDALSVFSSTYDSYLIITNGIMSATGTPRLWFRFAVAGAATNLTTFYIQSSGTIAGGTQNSAGYIEMTLEARGVASGSNANGIASRMFVYDVNSTTRNKYFDGMTNFYSTGAGAPSALASSGSYQNTNVVTGFRLLWDGGQNFAALGSVRVYGLKNS